MHHKINLQSVRKQAIYRLSDKFFGTAPDGDELGFTNSYMILNDKPFFGISGECHFSRVSENQWEDTILKMKAGGLNIISTYVFWIHHEEIEGQFRFDGRRNLRKYVELCKKHGMYVIVRVGPFAHGEARNGGLPDWFYGKPFEVRGNNDGFLHSVRLFYRAIAKQLDGLYFKDGGPVIAAQMDNEYMHSAAPWEITNGTSKEWMTVGTDGDAYLLQLKQIAREEGIITPFYTCTGWGGAATPTEEMLPLWGGYAYWPWIFYDHPFEHPATPEYLYRDNHNNAVRKTYNFEPFYEPESVPYACCEMGGGMANYYNYRFQLDYESVDAMANIKLGSGCNFLGYYMYRGGSNPHGERTPFLNEGQCTKISYDYQAPIGEFGQIRPSFSRLKALHLFLKHFADQLCELVTVLPEHSQEIDPTDADTLRYAVRTDGKSGFLFLNNYQDHAVCREKKDETISLILDDGTLTIPNLSLAAGESAILPFHMDLDGLHLIYAKAQPLTVVRTEEKSTWYFFTPEGMQAEYLFESKQGIRPRTAEFMGADFEENIRPQTEERMGADFVENIRPRTEERIGNDSVEIIRPESGKTSSVVLHAKGREIEIVTLTREDSLRFYELEVNGEMQHLFSDDVIYSDGNKIYTEHTEEAQGELKPVQCGPSRYTLTIPETRQDVAAGEITVKDILLKIDYRGDIGHLFTADGTLVSDNFSNDGVWEIGLGEIGVKAGDVLTIYITPRKENVQIDVSSTMAGRQEKVERLTAELRRVSLSYVKQQEI